MSTQATTQMLNAGDKPLRVPNFQAYMQAMPLGGQFKYVDSSGVRYVFTKVTAFIMLVENVDSPAVKHKDIADWKPQPSSGYLCHDWKDVLQTTSPTKQALGRSTTPTAPSPAKPLTCRCELRSLLQQGCVCGNIERYRGGF